MASIHRHSSGRSPYWFASFQTPAGTFTLRSTKQTERRKALQVALEFEAAAKKGRAGDLTAIQCRKVLSDILEKTTGETLKHATTKEFFDGWLKAKEAKKSEGTAERYANVCRLFLSHLGAKANRPITAVSASDVESFLITRQNAGLAGKTLVVDAKILNGVFRRAMQLDLISGNPMSSVELDFKVSSSERHAFTSSQVALLVATASDDWKTAILLGYYTSARLTDCANMRFADVDFTHATIRFKPKKTGEDVTVPLHSDLEAHLLTIAGTDTPREFLCPSLAGKGTGGAHGLSRSFKAIMREAGIDCAMQKGQGFRKFSKLSFHSLRHSFNSELANRGVSQETRMKLTGHKDVKINTGYTHHEMKVLREAVEKIPSVRDEQ